MTTERLRTLERQWKSSGDLADEAAYLHARVQVGELCPEALEVLRLAGHAAACMEEEPPSLPHWGDTLECARELDARLPHRVLTLGIFEIGLLWIEHASGESCELLRQRWRLAMLRGEGLELDLTPLPSTPPGEGNLGLELLHSLLHLQEEDALEGFRETFEQAVESLRNADEVDATCRALIASCVLGYWVPSRVPLKIRYRSTTKTSNDDSYASDPGEVSLSLAKLRLLAPEICEPPSLGTRVLGLLRGQALLSASDVRDFQIEFSEHLQGGDSRAAVVISLLPFLVAAYTDELDCVALLEFPRTLAKESGLKPGSRLLTVNRYMDLEYGLASDLWQGDRSLHHYGNFGPFIADFLSDDTGRITRRKREIREEEWHRCQVMGQALRKSAQRPRDGKPHRCWTWAGRLKLDPAKIAETLRGTSPSDL